MLKPFLFRIRNPQRDQQTDAERFARLVSHINDTISAVAAEQEGLDRRYKSSQADAALLMMASDNDDVSEEQAQGRLETLESTIVACEQRLKELGSQQDILRRVRAEIEPLLASPKENAL